MSKPVTYQKNLYLYEGKKLGLSKIVQKLHPGSTPAEHKKYYARYFTRIKNGATLEQAIAARDQILNQKSSEEQLVPEALPVATETLEIPEVEVEVKEDKTEEEYERALAYASKLYVTFRKYEGRTLAYVLQTEPTYIEWMRKKLVQSYSENPRDVVMLRGINQLYNDYPIAQDIIMKAKQAYYDRINQENHVPAAISLADSPQLQKLTALSPIPIVETPVEMEEGVCDFTGLAFEQLLTMQAEQQQESQALREEQLEMDARRLAILSRLQELDHSQALLTQRIEELTPKVPEVTDHAMVRYLERVMGMDVEDLKRQIVGFEDRSWLFDYQTNGSGRYLVSDTHRVHITNNTIVTVLPR